ncbi:hypothetical protein JG677_03110 [Campylobacter sp. TTU-622]|uniref:hypothetical protein n=1 Tax=Campylobacter sp. TTU-622 TaxID=2800583 RepID=UPI0019059B39|nr:hypothetical protein [Campylobacter sp. TTU-622]MBK1973041.1 hypothetical protein [Campylobacter sp. TTU-622]
MAKKTQNENVNNNTNNNVNEETQKANTSNINKNPEEKRMSRSEFIRKRVEDKKKAIDLNTNAQVFISDSIAGAEIFSALRMLDAMDSTIRKLWGNGVQSEDAEKWIKEITSIKENITNLQVTGKEILVKIGNVRHISNNVLRRTILKEIQAKNVKTE